MKSKIILVLGLITMTGCVKETYDMDKLSKWSHLSPSFGIPAVKGNISIRDIVEPNDTIVFDDDNFIKIVVKEDSIIDFSLSDYYDFDDLVSFSHSYPVGELVLDPFTGTVKYPVNQISSKFTPPVTYTTGTYPGFPSFPAIDIGEKTYSDFSNFEYATFSSGSLEITVKNNLPVTLGGLTIRIYNTATHTQTGGDIIISSISPGSIGTGYLDLKDLTVTSSITAAVQLHATNGTASPVQIDVNTTNIEITVSGTNMKVKSGRVILPVQEIEDLDGSDTLSFEPGEDIEIDEVKIKTGTLSYTAEQNSSLKAILSLTLPKSLRNSIPITETITLPPDKVVSDTISFDDVTLDLGSVVTQPYNMVPLTYTIKVSSDGNMIDFNSEDEVNLSIELPEPSFDYIKGYFGKQTETLDPDTVDLDIKEILEKIKWDDLLISSPSIKLNYSNSFAVPIEVELNAVGYKEGESIELNLDPNPFPVSYPAAPAERDKNAVFTIDRINSRLPELISMVPEEVRFSGSAVMNPGGNTGARDNYLFGNSRFIGSLEVEVPLEFRLHNLQFSDTIDNFLKDENPDDNDSPFSLEDLDYVKIIVSAENGFPLGISVSMSLYDPVKGELSKIDADNILEPALTDNNGKVTAPTESEVSIEITSDFWNSVNDTDEIILKFLVNTTDSDKSKDVKIYSDYYINYNVAVVVKADVNF